MPAETIFQKSLTLLLTTASFSTLFELVAAGAAFSPPFLSQLAKRRKKPAAAARVRTLRNRSIFMACLLLRPRREQRTLALFLPVDHVRAAHPSHADGHLSPLRRNDANFGCPSDSGRTLRGPGSRVGGRRRICTRDERQCCSPRSDR